MPRPVTHVVAIVLLALPLPAGAKAADPPAKGEKPRPRLVVQLGHSGGVLSLALSPDGKMLATAGYDLDAILWDVETAKVIRRLEGHRDGIVAVAFAPDGKAVVTGSTDKTAIVWDVATGKPLRHLKGHAGAIRAVAFSPDGKAVLTCGADGLAVLWARDTGKELCRFTGHTGEITSAAFTPDGKHVLTGSTRSPEAVLWDADTGKEVRRFKGRASGITAVAISPDGKRALTGSLTRTATLWDVATAKQLKEIEDCTNGVTSLAFSADGKRFVAGAPSPPQKPLLREHAAAVWDIESGREVQRFRGCTGVVMSVAFTATTKHAFVGCHDGAVALWDAETGKAVRPFGGNRELALAAAISHDGKRLAVGALDGRVIHWDLDTGGFTRSREVIAVAPSSIAISPLSREVLVSRAGRNVVLVDVRTGTPAQQLPTDHTILDSLKAAISPDGKQALTAGRGNNTPTLWDLKTGKKVREFQDKLATHAKGISGVAFSHDGKRAATAGYDGTVVLWNAESGREIRAFTGRTDSAEAVAFSPDDGRVVTGSFDKSVVVWDATTGKQVVKFEGHGFPVSAAAFSPDGKWVLSGDVGGVAFLWDAETGKEIHRFQSDCIRCVGVLADKKRAITVGQDTITIWDTGTGAELCRIVHFRDGTWAVVDPTGRFDAPKGGDVSGLHWVIGNEPVSLDQLKERYYDPGLLTKHLGLSKDPLRAVENFANPRLFPTMSVEQPNAGEAKFKVILTNRDGGIGRVVVRVNGKEITSDARPRGSDPNAAKLELPIDLTGDKRLKPGEANVIEVEAYNAEGYLRSRGFEVRYSDRGQKDAEPPEVWVVAVGVSKYAGPGLELKFAAKDAEDMALGFRVAAGGLFGPERLHLTLLTTDQKDAEKQPTRANVIRALEGLKKARPQDVVVVYFAGHGVNEGGAEGDYYYLAAEARSGSLADPAVREQVAVSSQQLADLLRQCPAAKQVLILDTCAAGKAVDKLTDKRDLPSSQVRALERVKDRTGTHVLAGCAADSVSYEATRYAQGVLTYSLLLGMRGGALKEDQHVDVATLFNFASDRVPELARDLGGIQRPVVASPKGESFPIGIVTQQDQAKIPLRPARPLVLQSNFQEEEMFKDVLSLGRRVDERLRAATARGGSERLVFVDAREMPDAYGVFGRYRVEKGKVTVTLRLARGQEKSTAFIVEGEESKPDELADRIGAAIEKRLNAMTEQK